ncbi:nucleolar protein 14 [Tirmania nivea]|nr:nucleolar protein 14 [Tirmania nivea]
MPASQLKRLKTSLKAAGVIGNQKSKKEKLRNAKAGSDARVDKQSKLRNIREEFNPFELKTTRVKHDVSGRGKLKGVQGRPGISKQIGEETRKKTLLVEMQKRNKAGGIVDRRFGENDPTIAPEDRMLERFTREKQSRLRNGDIFNLEDDDAELTHFGQSLGGLDEFDQGDTLSDGRDEFDQGDILRDDSSQGRKRRVDGLDEESDAQEKPARKKSRAEVMKEVIAKSKMHKYERQKAKDEDEDIREELDAQMGEVWQLLAGPRVTQAPPPPQKKLVDGVDAGRLALMNGEDKEEANKKYDTAVKEMLFDKRSKPADRTKTAEEKALEEAERLKKLEEARLRRMRGEVDSEDEQGKKKDKQETAKKEEEDDDDEEGDYGFGKGIPETLPARAKQPPNPDQLVDGDYEYDKDFEGLDNSSDAEHSDDYDSDVSKPLPESDDEEFDAEFLADVLPAKGDKERKIQEGQSEVLTAKEDTVAFTYTCPATHKEFLAILKDIPVEELPTVIHRIRVLYSPKLAEGNKEKLSGFSVVLLEHIMYVATTTSPSIPFGVLETAIRHLHALTKQHPLKVSEAFRAKLDELHQKSPNEWNAGDLLMLTAMGTIYPTSDHFHPVITPGTLIMAKYLGQHPPSSLKEMAVGSYITTLLIKGQRLSKRVIPETINYVLLSICLLAPVPLPTPLPGAFPYHEPVKPLRIMNPPAGWVPRKPNFSDMFSACAPDTGLALMHTLLHLLTHLVDLYAGSSAFTSTFFPAKSIVSELLSLPDLTTTPSLPASLTDLITGTLTTLNAHLAHAHRTLRPLELHHHRPLPIPSNIPKFHEEYSLDKRSYDPDRERVALQKLKAEHKKERKGALTELRKDAAFIAREKLKEEKAASKEYHAKMARLTAIIQHEEGQRKNEYEREKRARKGKK